MSQLGNVFTLDSNSYRHIAIILATIALGYMGGAWYMLVYPAAMLVIDILNFGFNIPLLDATAEVSRGYQVSAMFNDVLFGKGLDYGFNFYNGDYTKTRDVAQIDKFMFAWDKLKLKPGMRVLDIGCGCGDWLNWLRTRGVSGVGINITIEQVRVCRGRSLDVIHGDWREMLTHMDTNGLENAFDAVTYWDSPEHFVPSHYKDDVDKSDAIYKNMFVFAQRAMKKDSECRNIFVSCIHLRKTIAEEKDMRRKFHLMKFAYLLTKFHSGLYPSASRDDLVRNASAAQCELQGRFDTTVDYYMTSKLDPTHFGRHRFKLTVKRALYMAWLMVADPCWIHRIIWYFDESWMDQFDARDINQSAVLHYWLVFHARS